MIRTTIASILLVSAFAAQAEGPIENLVLGGPSTVTRAEVIAELHRANAAGEVAHGERSYEAKTTGRALSRAEVRAELPLAKAAGWVNVGEATAAPELDNHRNAPVRIARDATAARAQ
jgi:hypothetical protein